MTMNRAVAALAVGASSALLGAAAQHAGTKALRNLKARTRNKDTHRSTTGGCDPDIGYYVNAPLSVAGVDGSHMGLAVAALRDHMEQANGNEGEQPLDLPYSEALRSCIELAAHLGERFVTRFIEDPCGDPDCAGHSADAHPLMLWTTVAERFSNFGREFEKSAVIHARDCRSCRKAGREAPLFQRAKFCRGISDTVVPSIFGEEEVQVHGVPIQAALDVLETVIEATEEQFGVSQEDQFAELSSTVAEVLMAVDELNEDEHGTH